MTLTKPTATTSTPRTLDCPYCKTAMSLERFVVWPAQPKLFTGVCEGCQRSVTIPRQWLSLPSKGAGKVLPR